MQRTKNKIISWYGHEERMAEQKLINQLTQ
jgi:hypothetical protein